MTTVAEGSTLVARRRSSHSLPKLRIGRGRSKDDFDFQTGDVLEDSAAEETWESEEEVAEEGKQLFHNFVFDRVSQETPDAVEKIKILTPVGYANPVWAKAGRELRHMADAFAQTAERRRVKKKASEVSTNISYEEFKDLLSELFAAGGITKERIVVLFFFCSDVAIRCLKGAAELCAQFIQWSISFITEKVCSWVRSHGGWGEVMGSSFNSFPRVIFLATAFVIGFGVVRYYITRQ